MKTFSKVLFLFLSGIILLTTSLKAQNRSIQFEHGKWADVLAKAKKENKLIYLDCFTTWCGPCKWMEKNVFTKDSVADFYNSKFVNVKMDMEKGEGKDLAKKYAIQAYPTMLYINAQGEVIHRTCGSNSPEGFIATGMNALDPEKQLAGSAKKFNGGKTDGKTALTYLKMLEAGCQEYEKELSAYFATQTEADLTSRNNWNMIYAFSNDYSSKEFMYLEKQKETFDKLYTADSVKNKINRVYIAGLSLAIRKKDDKNYEVIKTKIRESGNPDAENIIMDADLKLYKSNKDWDKYASTAVSFIDKFAKEDADILNNIAWSFYENITDKKMLETASAWAKHSTELQDTFSTNDTYAALLFKLEKKAEAKAAAEKAIELAKKNGDKFEETAALLKEIEKLK